MQAGAVLLATGEEVYRSTDARELRLLGLATVALISAGCGVSAFKRRVSLYRLIGHEVTYVLGLPAV